MIKAGQLYTYDSNIYGEVTIRILEVTDLIIVSEMVSNKKRNYETRRRFEKKLSEGIYALQS